MPTTSQKGTKSKIESIVSIDPEIIPIKQIKRIVSNNMRDALLNEYKSRYNSQYSVNKSKMNSNINKYILSPKEINRILGIENIVEPSSQEA